MKLFIYIITGIILVAYLAAMVKLLLAELFVKISKSKLNALLFH
jgi:hypothetical protein